jgi:hypothetical protein
MLVAAISSAHMLGWLNIAFGMQIEAVSYLDRVDGEFRGRQRDEPRQLSSLSVRAFTSYDFRRDRRIRGRAHRSTLTGMAQTSQ